MKTKQTKYALTGSTGYIGSNLLDKLSKDENNFIYAIVRKGSVAKVIKPNIEYVVYDGTEQSLEKPLCESDYLIHLGALYTASNSENDAVNLINSNILFSTQLFNVAGNLNPEIVIASASTFSSLDESGKYAPATLYAATKRAVEDIAYFYEDLSIHFLTLPDTYGKNDWRPKIHNIVVKNKNWPFTFRSPEEQEMRLMHVSDVIGHLLSSLENTEKGVHIHDIFAEAPLLTLGELSKLITDNICLFSENSEPTKIPERARANSTPTGFKTYYDKNHLTKTIRETLTK